MNKFLRFISFLVSILLFATSIFAKNFDFKRVGKIESGIKYITLDEIKNSKGFIELFRGDYVIIKDCEDSLIVPKLKLKKLFNDNKYVKFKKNGVFEFELGDIKGKIRVVEFAGENYQFIDAEKANNIITKINPLILDVRTPQEYNQAHLKGAVLIPLNEIEQRVNEISKYKNSPILIYCASGNRSTVASRILLKNSFKRIYNLKGGIRDWYNRGYKIVK